MNNKPDEKQQSEASATCVASPPLNDWLAGQAERGDFRATFDGMTWPKPGMTMNGVIYALKYCTPNKAELLMAAEVLMAYKSIFNLKPAERNELIRKIQAC